MNHLRSTLLAAALAVIIFAPHVVTAQQVSDPAVMAIIGDVGSPKARKVFFKKIELGPRKKQCRAQEWEKFGFRWGITGAQAAGGIMSATRTCKKKYGAVFDKARYLAGHREGAIMYCGYESGMRFGYRQRLKNHTTQPSHHLCKRGIYPTFDTGYRVSTAKHRMREAWRKDVQALSKAERAYKIYLESQYDGVSRPEVRRKLARLQQDIDNAKEGRDVSKIDEYWSARIKAFEKTYHMESLNGKQDFPDAELDYTIPTYP